MRLRLVARRHLRVCLTPFLSVLQTGSGKTFSMMGDDKNPGIIPMMNQDLFARVAAGVADGRKFLIIVSYLEIYNEARTLNAQACGCTGVMGPDQDGYHAWLSCGAASCVICDGTETWRGDETHPTRWRC